MLIEFSILFLTLVVLIFWIKNQRPTNFPPGPQPLPFIGNLLTVGLEPHIACWELSKKYGPIVGIKFGPDLAICLHGTQLIKEGYNNGLFSGRFAREAHSFVSGDEMGIANANADTWVEQRRFALRHLRDFGFGKSSMEDLIMDEVKDFVEWLKIQNSTPVALQHRFSLAVVNSLWKIVTGKRFPHDDQKLHTILEDLERAGRTVLGFNAGKNLFIFFYPEVGKKFPKVSGWDKLEEMLQQRVELFDKVISEHAHAQALSPNSAPRDFVDAYLLEIQRTTDKKSSFHAETSGVRSLRSVMADFFVAGTDTTAVTLTWLMIYLLHNPTVQRKLHEELDHVVEKGSNATFSDRNRLPYTEAVILETLRLSSIAGLSVPHAATDDMTFHGYSIPKGTLILANLYANHHDPEIWGDDVEMFKPERFLSEDESNIVKNEALIPFSTGKRVCPGETLARDSLFLFTANLALNFEVSGVAGQPLPPLDYKRGQLTLAPVCDVVVMKQRR